MTKQTDFTKIFADMPNMLDTKAFENGFQNVAEYNEKVTGIATESASNTADIMADATKRTIENTGALTAARSNPSDYAQAFADYAQAQMEVAQRTSEAFLNVLQNVGGKFSDVNQKAGEKTAQKAADTAKTAAKAA